MQIALAPDGEGVEVRARGRVGEDDVGEAPRELGPQAKRRPVHQDDAGSRRDPLGGGSPGLDRAAPGEER